MLILGAAAYAVGIALGRLLGLERLPGAWTAAWLLVALGALAVVLAARRRSAAMWAAVRARPAWIVLVVWLCGGAVRLAERSPSLPPELTTADAVTVEATVESMIRVRDGTEVEVRLDRVTRDAQTWAPADLHALVVVRGEPLEPLLPGDAVHFRARLRTVEGPANPGADDGADHWRAEGILLRCTLIAPGALVRWARPAPWGLRRSVARAREQMRRVICDALVGPRRALVLSLVLGDRSLVEQPLDDAFRAAGVSHVLSVSGLHLAMAAFLFYFAVDRLTRRWRWLVERVPARRVAALVSIPAVLVYTLLTGAEVATERACVVALVYLSARVLDRRASTAEALVLGAWLLLAAAPHELFVASFQLSVAAALGTALAARRLSLLRRPRPSSLLMRLWRWASSLFWVSLAALALTAPLAVWHFSQLSVTGLGANFLVVPLAELFVVPVGLAGAALTPLWFFARHLIELAGVGAQAMIVIVNWFARRTPAGWVPQPTIIELVAWYGVAVPLLVGGRRALRVAAVAALVLMAALGWRAAAPRLWPELRVTFLDVGQADAAVIELPSGHAIIVDGGGSFDASYDPGERIVGPYLRRRGIAHLDLVVLSHPHPDHANGLPYLVANFPVDEIWPAAETSQLPAQRALLDAAAHKKIPLGPLRSVEVVGVRIDVIGPRDLDDALAADAAATENDNSIVLVVSYRGRRILFAGDIEKPAETRLQRGLPHVDVVKVPHHGSPTSSTLPFIAATAPTWAVISVGRDNRWHFPSPDVVKRWQAAGADVLRTDRDGAVTILVHSDGSIEARTVR